MKICNAVMRQRQCRVFLAMLRWVKGGRVGADWMFPKIEVPQDGWFMMENPY